MIPKEPFVVRGGPDRKIFNNKNKEKWDKKEKLKIVTHHWSGNWMKGFDTYCLLDQLIEEKKITAEIFEEEFYHTTNFEIYNQLQDQKIIF